MNQHIVLLATLLLLPGCLSDCPGIPLESDNLEPFFAEPLDCTQTESTLEERLPKDLVAMIHDLPALADVRLSEQKKNRQTVRFTSTDFGEEMVFRDEWGERTYHMPITCNNDMDLHLQKHLNIRWDGVPYTCNLTIKNISSKPLQIDLKSRHFEIMFADVREYIDDEDKSSQDRHSDSSKWITLAGLNLDGTTLHPGEEVVMFIEIEQELSQSRYDVYIAYEKKESRNWGREDSAISNIVSLVVVE